MTELLPTFAPARPGRSADMAAATLARRDRPVTKEFSAVFSALITRPAVSSGATSPSPDTAGSPQTDRTAADAETADEADAGQPTAEETQIAADALHVTSGGGDAARDGAQTLVDLHFRTPDEGIPDPQMTSPSAGAGLVAPPVHHETADPDHSPGHLFSNGLGLAASGTTIADPGQRIPVPTAVAREPGSASPRAVPASDEPMPGAAWTAFTWSTATTSKPATQRTASETGSTGPIRPEIGGDHAGQPLPAKPNLSFSTPLRPHEAGMSPDAGLTASETLTEAANRGHASHITVPQSLRSDPGTALTARPDGAQNVGAAPGIVLSATPMHAGSTDTAPPSDGDFGSVNTATGPRSATTGTTARLVDVTTAGPGSATESDVTPWTTATANPADAVLATTTDPGTSTFAGLGGPDGTGVPANSADARNAPRLNAAAPDLSQQIARYLADAPAEAAGRGIELRLSPEELGPVRLTLRHVDGQMMVTVAVERPETLDLMRRHADQLLQDMRALGYGSVRLDMQAQGERRPPQHLSPPDDDGLMAAPVSPPLPDLAPQRLVTGGLDLRF